MARRIAPTHDQLRRQVAWVRLVHRTSREVVTRHDWGWTIWWAYYPSGDVTRQVICVKRPRLGAMRLLAAAARLRPVTWIDLGSRGFGFGRFRLSTAIAALAAILGVAIVFLGAASSVPMAFGFATSVIMLTRCRPVLVALTRGHLRFLQSGSVHFEQLMAAADLLDGMDSGAKSCLGVNPGQLMWAAANPDVSLTEVMLLTAQAEATNRAAGFVNTLTAHFGPIRAATWSRLAEVDSRSPHAELLGRITRRLAMLDPSTAAEAGVDPDTTLAEAAQSEEHAAALADCLAVAVRETLSTQRVEMDVADAVEVGSVEAVTGPTLHIARRRLAAYRAEMEARAVAAEAAVAAVHRANGRPILTRDPEGPMGGASIRRPMEGAS